MSSLCRFQGKIYPSISQASRETGFHRLTISRAIEAGTEDRVGLRPNMRREWTCNVAVEFRGGIYPSIAKASRMTGVSEDTVVRECHRLNRHTFGGPKDQIRSIPSRSSQPPTGEPAGVPVSSAAGS